MTPGRGLLLGLVLAALLWTGPARAQARQLVLTARGPDAEVALLTSSLGELLGRLGVSLASGTEGGGPGLLAKAVVELSPDEGRLSLADAEGTVVLYRRIPRRASAAVLVESVAHVLHSAVTELLEPRRVVAPSAPPIVEAPSPLPAAAPEDEARVGLELGAFVGGRAFERTAVVVSAGVGVSVSARLGRLRPALSLVGSYNSPFDAASTLVDLRTQSASLRLLPTLLVLERGWFSLEVGAGGGVDLLFTQVRSSELPPGLLSRERVDAAPILTGLLAARASVSDNTDLVLGLTLDADLAPRRFVADLPGARQVVFWPWRFRPALVAGFSFGAAGARPHGGRR